MVHLHLKHLPWEQKLFLYVWWYSLFVMYFAAEDMPFLLPVPAAGMQPAVPKGPEWTFPHTLPSCDVQLWISMEFPHDFCECNKSRKHPCKHWRRRREGAAGNPQHPVETVILEQTPTLLLVKRITVGQILMWRTPHQRRWIFQMLPGLKRQNFPNDVKSRKIKSNLLMKVFQVHKIWLRTHVVKYSCNFYKVN